MKINTNYIRKRTSQNGWSQNELSRRMQLPRGTLSNVLSGKRGAGRKVIAGLLRVFPEERIEDLILTEG